MNWEFVLWKYNYWNYYNYYGVKTVDKNNTSQKRLLKWLFNRIQFYDVLENLCVKWSFPNNLSAQWLTGHFLQVTIQPPIMRLMFFKGVNQKLKHLSDFDYTTYHNFSAELFFVYNYCWIQNLVSLYCVCLPNKIKRKRISWNPFSKEKIRDQNFSKINIRENLRKLPKFLMVIRPLFGLRW